MYLFSNCFIQVKVAVVLEAILIKLSTRIGCQFFSGHHAYKFTHWYNLAIFNPCSSIKNICIVSNLSTGLDHGPWSYETAETFDSSKPNSCSCKKYLLIKNIIDQFSSKEDTHEDTQNLRICSSQP